MNEGIPVGNNHEAAVVADEVITPEEASDFGRVIPLIMDSYKRKNGRTFDPDQVRAMAEGMLSMANTIDMAKTYTLAIEAMLFKMGDALGLSETDVYDIVAKIQQGVPLDEIEVKKRKFWTPG